MFGGLMQLVAYGGLDVYLGGNSVSEMSYYENSTTLNRGKYNRYAGNHNFYNHVKKSKSKGTTNKSKLSENKSAREKEDMYCERYDYSKNSSSKNCTKIFCDKIYVEKSVLFENNNRKYKNIQILFYYSKFMENGYNLSEYLNKTFEYVN